MSVDKKMEQEIREALKNATTGEWTKVEFFNGTMEVWKNAANSPDGVNHYVARIIGNNDTATHNADLIANTPKYLEWCLSQIAELRRENDVLVRKYADLEEQADIWREESGN